MLNGRLFDDEASILRCLHCTACHHVMQVVSNICAGCSTGSLGQSAQESNLCCTHSHSTVLVHQPVLVPLCTKGRAVTVVDACPIVLCPMSCRQQAHAPPQSPQHQCVTLLGWQHMSGLVMRGASARLLIKCRPPRCLGAKLSEHERLAQLLGAHIGVHVHPPPAHHIWPVSHCDCILLELFMLLLWRTDASCRR